MAKGTIPRHQTLWCEIPFSGVALYSCICGTGMSLQDGEARHCLNTGNGKVLPDFIGE